MRVFAAAVLTASFFWPVVHCNADALRPIALKSTITEVQPMTGIVLWTTNASVAKGQSIGFEAN